MIHFFRTLPSNYRIIMSGVIGNLLESFDIMICAYLAQNISQTFFPPTSSNVNIFYTFLVFCVGYLSRPFGSLLMGLFADQIGRKKMLVYSIIITGLCTALIGAIPSYQSIGNYALCLFLFLRILQNVSVGGEYISSISYLIESADKNKKGFYGSWISVGFNGGNLLASLSVYILLSSIHNQYLAEWSWRLIFFLALVGTLLGYWIRISLPESLEFILNNSSSVKKNKFEIMKSSLFLIKSNTARCLSLIAIAWLGVSETSAIFVYSPIHMTTFNHLTQHEALEINTLSLALLTLIIPIFGLFYDRYDRIRLLMLTIISFILLSPIYFYYLSSGSYYQILIIKLLFSIPSACYYALATVLITESFPVNVRCTSLAFLYQTTVSIGAGTSPIILLTLAQYQSIKMLPAILIIISGLVCLFALRYIAKLHETELVENEKTLLLQLSS